MLHQYRLRTYVLVTAMFFLWGIPNNLNDILIKQFMKSFEITRFEAGFLQSAFYLGYFLLSVPSGIVMRKYGYKTAFLIGLSLYCFGTILFYPAALVQQYLFFLLSLFIIASGLSFLETTANTFITTEGDKNTTERRLTLAQSFNPLGSIIGVFIGTFFIFTDSLTADQLKDLKKTPENYSNYLKTETMQVVKPYLVLSLVVALLGILVWKTDFPKHSEPEPKIKEKEMSETMLDEHPIPLEQSTSSTKYSPPTLDPPEELSEFNGNYRKIIFSFPLTFYLGVIAQFFYVGAQVGIWSYFIQYLQDYVQFTEKTAGYCLTATLFIFGIGRFLSVYFMKIITAKNVLSLFSIVNAVFSLYCTFLPGTNGCVLLSITSFFMGPMFPTIFALSMKEIVGVQLKKLAGSLIIMSIVGGAVVPPLMGWVAERFESTSLSFVVPSICFVYIAYFSFCVLTEK